MPVRDKNATEGHIYGLFDPRHPLEPSYCRYVGQTINEVTQRLRDHIAEAQRSTSRRWVLRWIRKLLREEVVPVVQVLEFVQDSDPLVFAVLIDEAEQRWIAKGRIEGWRLTNHSGGGRGNRGYVFTPEQRKHQGDVARGRKHTEATKAKMSAASKGRPKSPEHRASLSTARKGMPNTEAQAEAAAKRRGIPLSQATKRKQSESIKNSPEMQRFWESRRGVPMPEDQKQKISESNTQTIPRPSKHL